MTGFYNENKNHFDTYTKRNLSEIDVCLVCFGTLKVLASVYKIHVSDTSVVRFIFQLKTVVIVSENSFEVKLIRFENANMNSK